jgi:hypothetical protein
MFKYTEKGMHSTSLDLEVEVLERLNKVDISQWINVIFEAKNLLVNPNIFRENSPSRTIRKGSMFSKDSRMSFM